MESSGKNSTDMGLQSLLYLYVEALLAFAT